MSDRKYGITDKGFVLKPQPVIFNEVQADIITAVQTLFPDALIDTSLQSVFGQIAQSFSFRESAMWQLSQQLYNMNRIDSSGDALDNVAGYHNLRRLEATNTIVPMIIYADENTVIPQNFEVTNPTTLDSYISTNTVPITLTSDTVIEVNFSIASVLPSTLYSVSINSVLYAYTTGSSDTPITVASAITTLVNEGQELIDAIDNDDGTFKIISSDKELSWSSAHSANIDVDSTGYPLLVKATTLGKIFAPAGSITHIVTQIQSGNVDSVLNLVPGVPGREVETDEELRVRIQTKKSVNSTCTIDAMRSNLIQNVSFVNDCSVYQNYEDSPDQYGRPPHSVEVVVDCPTVQHQAVANEIFANLPVGTDTFGSTGMQGITGVAVGNLQSFTGIDAFSNYRIQGVTGAQGVTGSGNFSSISGWGLVRQNGHTGVQGVTGVSGLTGVASVTGIQGATAFQSWGRFTVEGVTNLAVSGLTGLEGITGIQGIGQVKLNGFTGTQGITGCNPIGLQQYTVIDQQLNPNLIYFSKPDVKFAWIYARIDRNRENVVPQFPNSGTQLSAEALLAYGNSIALGQDLIVQQFVSSIYSSVKGISNIILAFSLTGLSTEAPDWLNWGENLVISPTTRCSFDISRIFVEINS